MLRPAFLLSFVCCAIFTPLAADGSGAPATDEYSGEYFLPSGKRVSVFKEGVLAEMARSKVINWDTGRVGMLE